MRIDINKNICITSDTYGFHIMDKSKKVNKDTGKEEELLLPSTHAHHSSLENCVKELCNKTVRESKTINDMQKTIDELHKIEDEIDIAFKPLHIKIVKDK